MKLTLILEQTFWDDAKLEAFVQLDTDELEKTPNPEVRLLELYRKLESIFECRTKSSTKP